MVEKTAKTPEGVSYRYFRCSKCGEEIVDMKQLHNVAEKYRIMKKNTEEQKSQNGEDGLELRPEFTEKIKRIQKQKSIRVNDFAKRYGLK